MTERNTRGSEWHKWDFHVHTPYSILNNNYGVNPFEPNADEESLFDNYVKELFTRAVNENISAIGITDYFMIEGYKRIKEKYLNCPEKMEELFPNVEYRNKISSIYVFPNIEFRLNTFVGKGSHAINYHVIFDSNCQISDIENNFLQKLMFEESPDNSLTLNRSNLERLGQTINQNNERSDNPFLVGLENITIKDKDIRTALENTNCFEGKYLILVPVDEDLSEISWKGRDYETRKNLYKQAHCYLTSNIKTRNWALALKDGKINESEANSRIIEFGSLKPCIWGSDAHEYERMFHPDKDMNCWLKTDVHFDGLKQILYEPNERVFIGEKPFEKDPHYLIDSITFDDDFFQKEKILFNSNLNCIIGGKSTGKSILLRTIAKTINSEHVEEQESHYSNFQNHYDVNEATVTWKDGTTDSRKIVYIPQTFLNNIVDDNENDNPVKKIIEETLLQDEEILEAKNVLNESKSSIKELLRTAVISLCQVNNDIQEVKKTILTYGSEEAYVKTIKSLEDERNSIVSNGAVNVSDITEFDEVSKKLEFLNQEVNNENTVLSNIKNIPAPFAFVPAWFEKNVDGTYELSNKYFGKYDSFVRNEFTKLNQLLSNDWNIFKTNIVSEIQKNKGSKEKEQGQVKILFEELNAKVSINNKVIEINSNIDKEKKTLEIVKNLNAKQTELTKSLKTFISTIVSCKNRYREAYDQYCSIVNEKNKALSENILFTAKTIWQRENFIESISSLFNQTQFPKFKERTGFDLKNIEEKDYSENFLNYLIFSMISSKKDISLPLKSSSVLETAILQIFGDWFTVHYDVKSGNDTIEVMSPGKKASVLLELLLSKANSECPILIDQPEDDLDNRSIYKDLACYLREKKTKRQIIIVTHNANLVLGADADEVIIANQDGTDSRNENYRFEYRSGAIEDNYFDSSSIGILYKKGIQEQICDILEGGTQAFKNRENKYKSILL